MNIKVLSNERGITLLHGSNGQIAIHSSCYGLVAEGNRVTEHNKDYSYCKAVYTLNICDWCGYWDLKAIIKRGITKWEKNDWNMDDCEINFNVVKGEEMNLHKTVDIVIEG